MRGGSDPSSQSTHAKQLLVRGMTRAYLDDHEGAISYYEEALELQPDEASILSALADAHLATDNPTTALFYAEQARDAASSNPYYAFRLADVQQQSGRTDAALATLRQTVDRFPDLPRAYTTLADAQGEAGRPGEAVATYEALLDADAQPPADVYPRLLRLYQQTGNEAGVERTLKRLVDIQPGNRSYKRLLADLYATQNRVEPALEIYQELLDADPKNLRLRMRVATLYRHAGRPDAADEVVRSVRPDEDATPDDLATRAESLNRSARAESDTSLTRAAVDLLERALDQDPQHAPALVLLGEIRYRTGDFAEAGQLLEDALKQNPRAPDRWTLAASAYLRAGQPQSAADVADEGLLLFPGRESLLKVSGSALLALDRPSDAASALEEAFEILVDDGDAKTPDAARIQTALGRAYHQLGRRDDATAAFEAALEADPNAATPKAAYALVLADRDDALDRALALAQEAVDRAPDAPDALHALGWVQYRRGNAKAAQTRLTEAIETGGASALTYEHAGDVARALGNADTARRYWRRALDLAPNRSRLQEKLDTTPK